MKLRQIVLTAALTALTALAGMLSHGVFQALVPFSLLPIMVYLSGIILGGAYGALAMLTYVLLGLFGLPIFASAPFAGFGDILKPTFGYLLGYIGAAFVVGKLYRPGSLIRAALGVLAGMVVLYFFGLSYLYAIFRWVLHRHLDVKQVMEMGFLPFILGDLLKGGIAVWVGNQVVLRRKESQT